MAIIWLIVIYQHWTPPPIHCQPLLTNLSVRIYNKRFVNLKKFWVRLLPQFSKHETWNWATLVAQRLRCNHRIPPASVPWVYHSSKNEVVAINTMPTPSRSTPAKILYIYDCLGSKKYQNMEIHRCHHCPLCCHVIEKHLPHQNPGHYAILNGVRGVGRSMMTANLAVAE